MAPRRLVRRFVLTGLVLLVAAQFVPVTRDNPPVESDVMAPAPVGDILRRACYDCHSNETVWPWYIARGASLVACRTRRARGP